MATIYPYLYRLLVTAWVGCLWTAGFLIAPLLFSTLSRTQAGAVAGQMFAMVNVISMAAGVLLLVLLLWCRNGRMARTRIACVVVMLLCTLFLAQVVTPRIQQAKAQLRSVPQNVEAGAQFARWHGISSTVYIVNCVLGAVLVVAGAGPRRRSESSLPR